MAVPAKLIGQIADNHFDATELGREPRGDERDPHWNVRWRHVPVASPVSGWQTEQAGQVGLRRGAPGAAAARASGARAA